MAAEEGKESAQADACCHDDTTGAGWSCGSSCEVTAAMLNSPCTWHTYKSNPVFAKSPTKGKINTALCIDSFIHNTSERAGQKDVLFDAMGYEANCSVVCQNKQKQWKLQTPTISTQYMRSISKSGLNSILVPYKENKDLNDMHQINFKQG